MFSLFRTNEGANSGDLSRDLQRLSRKDLLELLLHQVRENDRLRRSAEEQTRRLSSLVDETNRLSTRLETREQLLREAHEALRTMVRTDDRRQRMALFLQVEEDFSTHYQRTAPARASVPRDIEGLELAPARGAHRQRRAAAHFAPREGVAE